MRGSEKTYTNGENETSGQAKVLEQNETARRNCKNVHRCENQQAEEEDEDEGGLLDILLHVRVPRYEDPESEEERLLDVLSDARIRYEETREQRYLLDVHVATAGAGVGATIQVRYAYVGAKTRDRC